MTLPIEPPMPETASSFFRQSEIDYCLQENRRSIRVLRVDFPETVRGYQAEEVKPEDTLQPNWIDLNRQQAYTTAVPWTGDLNWFDVRYVWDFWITRDHSLYISGPARLDWIKRVNPRQRPRDNFQVVERERLARSQGSYIRHQLNRI